ncbi:hypothetical protein PHYSODRAFT_340420 [Phytophthora sojae]|uniref:Chromo domain-containing protein n=1 Tax=Phytophthora sojae (strain P6497) TaxID=1094619 RepID=G5A9N5_PHYSP|nr:hypothetical protein PHYSODRAFT_340420 [Phytophthora sojae]EGZ07315.1 hypothetical protein PHYSODRAFT_340420 [Phytophthora sojae]|eukprot:XP_009536881.1 hypothetical protein PHYSODRAFT_340420 [Phytophthora sojae]
MPVAREVFTRQEFIDFCRQVVFYPTYPDREVSIDKKAIIYMYKDLEVADEEAGAKLVGLILRTILEQDAEVEDIKEDHIRKFLQAAREAARLGTPVNAGGHKLVTGTTAQGTAATDSTATITTTAGDATPAAQEKYACGANLIDALGVVAMSTSDDERQQRREWTDLAEALHKEGNTLQTSDEAGKALGTALARSTMDETDAEQAALDVCHAAWVLAASIIRNRGADDAARAVKTALDQDLTWQIRCILWKMRAEDGTTLYLVDWEPTWEPPKHLNPEQIVRFEDRRFVRKFVDLEAKEVPARKPKSSSNNKPAHTQKQKKQARQKRRRGT